MHCRLRFLFLAVFLALPALGGMTSGQAAAAVGVQSEALSPQWSPLAVDFANFNTAITGVAAEREVAFVGEPLNSQVAVISRRTGTQIAVLPPPPAGFVLPLIMHAVSDDRIVILDTGGFPQLSPFAPVNPTLYEYQFHLTAGGRFSAALVRQISFKNVYVGFTEDFVPLDDGRYLVSDSVLGSIWVVERDGTIEPGIVPKSSAVKDRIPTLAYCEPMPTVTVNGYPFLFEDSSLPGVSPIAVRNGTVYYYSPCARGLYAFPLAVLSDARQPYQRAADIRLVAATPQNVAVEELLDAQFDRYDRSDPYLYAANALALQVIRIDVRSGRREVIASGAGLFDFPSSLAFLPPLFAGDRSLLVASNQQERTPLTNAAVSTTTFQLPFIVSKIRLTR
jgi:hypothetical protein